MQKYGTVVQRPRRTTLLPRHHLHPDFRAEVSNEDEVREGEVGVVEKVVKRADEVQVFGEFRVEPFVPVGRRTSHPDEVVERFTEVAGESQCGEGHAVLIQRVVAAVAERAPQLVTRVVLQGMQRGIVAAEVASGGDFQMFAVVAGECVAIDAAGGFVHFRQCLPQRFVEGDDVGQQFLLVR